MSRQQAAAAAEKSAPDPLRDVWAAEAAEGAARELIEELIEAAHVSATAAALEEEKLVPLTVRRTTADLLSVVRVFFLQADAGEAAVDVDGSWQPDQEPEPAEIDAWSRGAVPLRSRNSAVSLATTETAARPQSSGKPLSPRLRPKSRDGREADPLPPNAATANGVLIIKAKHKPATEPQPGLKSEKAPVVTDAEAARLRREAEEREDRLRLERLKAELKGREYTYDQMGNVILIDAINPDKLPAYQHAPRVGVGADADAAPAPTAGRGRGRGQRQKRVPGRGDSGLKLRPELVNKPTFKPLESLQPSLIDTMQLCPGVTLREGAAERCGGARAFDAAHMSRTEFELFGRTSPGPGAPRMYADAAVAPENPIGEWPISPHKLTELKPLPTPHDSITQTGRGPGPNSPQRGQASLSPTYGLRVRNSSGVKEKLPPTGLAS